MGSRYVDLYQKQAKQNQLISEIDQIIQRIVSLSQSFLKSEEPSMEILVGYKGTLNFKITDYFQINQKNISKADSPDEEGGAHQPNLFEQQM